MTRRGFVTCAAATAVTAAPAQDARKTRSYNPDMEYRPLGRTGMMVSAVSMGGHWKKIQSKPGTEEFKKNRRDVVYACLEHGINYLDACTPSEVVVYSEALADRREEIYLGFESTGARDPEVAGSVEKLKEGLDAALKKCKQQYVDVWRLTLREQATLNSERERDNVAEALAWAKKTGRARATGVSTHHRPWIAEAVAKYPSMEVIITPYAAGSTEKPVGSMFDAFRKHGTGFIAIKPFGSGNIFASFGQPESPTRREDDDRARLALRHVLNCDVLAATIPGLMTVDQVKNAAAAVKERRRLDAAEAARREKITARMWSVLPPDYQWLREWKWV
jgi:hypothetical protein